MDNEQMNKFEKETEEIKKEYNKEWDGYKETNPYLDMANHLLNQIVKAGR